MNGTRMSIHGGSFVSRRRPARRSGRVLAGLLVGRLAGPRPALERAASGFLRGRSRSYLARVSGDRRFAVAPALALVAGTMATALPPVNLSNVAAGNGGFVINGIDVDDRAGSSVSGAGDVNGDGLDDLIVGRPTPTRAATATPAKATWCSARPTLRARGTSTVTAPFPSRT